MHSFIFIQRKNYGHAKFSYRNLAIPICLVLFLILTIKSAYSENIYAQSLSRADIQSAVNSALQGDTIVLPAGTNNSFSGVVIISTDNIEILGAGSNSTHIGWTSGANRQDPVFWVMNTTGFELGGVHLFGTNNQSQREWLVKMHYSTNFRIHHCHFERSGAAGIDCRGYPMNGCIDNCTFEDGYYPGHGYGVYVGHSTQAEWESGMPGDSSWDADVALGTIDGIYIEDCTFETFRHMVATGAGARVVIRYSTFTSNNTASTHAEDMFDTHGWSPVYHGNRKYEIYENTIDCTYDHGYVSIRDSGDGVMFNNTITNLGYPDHYAFILNLPCCNHDTCNTANGWNGTYPEHDQTQLYYVWGNTLDGHAHNTVTVSGSCSNEQAAPIFLQNRDWFEYEPPPEIYTPFQYPHPFRQDGGSSIALSTNSLEFSAVYGGASPFDHTFQISNPGGGILDWNVSDNANWLISSPTSGQDNAQITVAANSSGLSLGTYTATITVTSPNADNSPQNISVTLNVTAVPDPLSAAVLASPSSGNAPLTVNFAGSATGGTPPYSYNWNFGDGGSSTLQNPTNTYSASGNYNVQLTVTDSASDQDTVSVTINISDSTTASLTLSTETSSAFSAPGGTTNPSPGTSTYPIGDTVQISASPITNYRFSKWAGDITGSAVYDDQVAITMDSNKSITAKFYTQCGDVNGDLNLTPSDSQQAFDIFLGKISNPTEAQKENADVNCDGTITLPNVTPMDAQAIFNKYLGREELPGDCSCNSRSGDVSSLFVQNKRFSQINLSIEDINGQRGAKIFVPILINNPYNLKAFGFDLAYPAEVLNYLEIAQTEYTQDFVQLDAHESIPGMLRVGGYKDKPIQHSDSGALLILIFEVKTDANGQSLFVITNTFDDLMGASIIPGRLIIDTEGAQPQQGNRPLKANHTLKK